MIHNHLMCTPLPQPRASGVGTNRCYLISSLVLSIRLSVLIRVYLLQCLGEEESTIFSLVRYLKYYLDTVSGSFILC
jgi:hypothetical protein